MKQFSRSVLVAALAGSMIVGCAENPSQESTGQYVDDSVITTKVKASLLNAPGLKSFQIGVDTYKGRVQLSGTVNSRDNIDEAVAIAYRTNGVTAVKNDLMTK
jgi:osmotically-inducible protein OsmY